MSMLHSILTLRPLRKAVKRHIIEYKKDKQFLFVPKWDGAVKKKSVLICEPHFSHGECLPGWTKYWQDLGYNVDIITRYENYIENPFCNYPNIRMPRFFGGSLKMLKSWLGDKRTKQYEYIFISTTILWDEGIEWTHILDYLGFVPKCKNGCLFVDHAPNMFFNKYNEQTLVEQKRIFALSHLSYMAQLNPHYFGEFKDVNKNKSDNKTVFVGIGRMSARNYDCLIDAIRKLKSQNNNFIVRVIGSGTMKIPDDLTDQIVFLGRLNYNDMYVEVEKSDFIIAGLDPFNDNHHQYLVGCTTGNLQLSLGFNKPMIINDLFGKHYELDNAAIYYKDNDVYTAMETAICMTGVKYQKLQKQLQALAKKTYTRSLDNLKNAIGFYNKTIDMTYI